MCVFAETGTAQVGDWWYLKRRFIAIYCLAAALAWWSVERLRCGCGESQVVEGVVVH